MRSTGTGPVGTRSPNGVDRSGQPCAPPAQGRWGRGIRGGIAVVVNHAFHRHRAGGDRAARISLPPPALCRRTGGWSLRAALSPATFTPPPALCRRSTWLTTEGPAILRPLPAHRCRKEEGQKGKRVPPPHRVPGSTPGKTDGPMVRRGEDAPRGHRHLRRAPAARGGAGGIVGRRRSGSRWLPAIFLGGTSGDIERVTHR